MENKHGNPIAFLKWVANYYNENGERIQLLDGEFHFVEMEDDTQVVVTPEQLVELYGIQQGDEKELSTLKAQQGAVTEDERELASKWVFETNGHKWSNNDNTAGDNYGSFVAGYEAARDNNINDAAEQIADKLMVIVKKHLGVTDESPNAYQELKMARDAAAMFCNKYNATATQLAETVDRAQALVNALEAITGVTMPVPNKSDMIEIANKALNAWNGNGQKKEGIHE